MTNTEPTPPPVEYEDPAALHFDLQNPRALDQGFTDDQAALEHLVDFDLNELVLSIAHSGWSDYEPLIVLRPGDIVLEGNRRLAALRILADPKLGNRLKVRLPENIGTNARPKRIRICRVSSRSEARAFIGFKHVNGPFKWDALAKARFAADWYGEEGNIDAIARRLGDTHRTVLRLVNGWNVLQQSQKFGFDMDARSSKHFAFSHLYTALARPAVRDYLGVGEVPGVKVLQRNPVPPSHGQRLLRFMSWLYGQKDEPAVIRSQNPDLNRLTTVLGNRAATAMLETKRDLDKAHDETEDKTVLFGQALMQATQHAEDASRLVGHYEGQKDQLKAGDNLRKTAVSIWYAMERKAERAQSGNAD